jgi:hypothetical protein
MSQRNICHVLAFFVLFCLCTFGSFAQTSASIQGSPQYSYGPTTDYKAALPTPSYALWLFSALSH